MTERPPIQRWWVTYVAVGAAAVAAVLWAGALLGQALEPVRELVFVLLFAIVIAFLLTPIVDLLARVMPRGLAILIAFLGALAIVSAGIGFIATPVVREARGLVERVPEVVRELQSPERVVIAGVEIPGDVKQRIGQELGERAGALVERSAGLALRFVTAIVDIVLVLVLALYILGAAPLIRRFVRDLVPRGNRQHVERLEDELASVFGRYVRGQLLLGLIIGVLNFVAFSALGLPYALLLGVIAGILELIPIVGPIVAGAIAATVAVFQPEPFPLVIWVIVAATAIQQLENHLLVPRISGGAVGIHPLAALLAVAVGIQMFGIVGGLFAVPTAGMAAIYLRRWLASRRGEEPAAEAGAAG